MIPAIANLLWLGACLPEYRRFHRAAKQVAREQAALLHRIVSQNADTEFGRTQGFGSVRSVGDFQRQVPLRDYDDFEDPITRTANGEKDVLTKEQVHFFEPTSGSTGASKLVPYTASLRQQFRCGIEPWVADLFLHYPELMAGSAYWSVSPVATTARHTPCGIPIGFDDDAAYLGGWQQRLVDSVMTVPSAIGQIRDMETVRYLTLLLLVSCRTLKLVSVWNPTFLTLLMEYLPQWGDEIARDLERGTISRVVAPVSAMVYVRKDPSRARDLCAALRCSSAAERHERLWPRLRLISCWADANAASPSAALQNLFPQARIQGKGLLATEGVVSFPLVGHDGAALAVRSHFFEFLPISPSGDSGEPRLAHELVQGRQYAVAITTGGGLYRYRMGDLIEVSGYLHDCPLVRFLGRHEQVSDWFGEKLNEAHVSGAMHKVFADHKISPAFAMLACDTRPAPGYVLYIDTSVPDRTLTLAASKMEEALCSNFHYRYARRLGQLAPLKVFRAQHAAAAYLQNAITSGQRAGNVKPAALDRRDIWWKVFHGQFVAEETDRPAAIKNPIPNCEVIS